MPFPGLVRVFENIQDKELLQKTAALSLRGRKPSPAWSPGGRLAPVEGKQAVSEGGCLHWSPVALFKPFSKHLRVLYKMGICSVESLYLLRTPMSRGLPLLQRQEAVKGLVAFPQPWGRARWHLSTEEGSLHPAVPHPLGQVSC